MQRVNVIVVYHHHQNKILMCYRTKEPYLGKYYLVGGKVEPGEHGLEAAYRELFEETGIKDSEIQLTFLMTFKYILDPCEVEVYFGKLNRHVDLIEETHPLYWMDLDEDFFNLERFAGEGNIGHMLEIIKKCK